MPGSTIPTTVLLHGARASFPRLQHGWVDAGYRGAFLDWAHEAAGIARQVVQRRDGGGRRRWLPPGAEPPVVPRFAVVPRRWVVSVRLPGWVVSVA